MQQRFKRCRGGDGEIETLLFAACHQGHLEVVGLLVKKGADEDAAKDDGCTPLFATCQNGHLEVVRLLVGKGADMDIAADNGAIPLYIKSGHLDVVQPPVQNWADLNKADYYGAALRFSACKSGHLDVVQLRVQNWANLNEADKYGLWRHPALQRMQERPPERRAAARTELGRPEQG